MSQHDLFGVRKAHDIASDIGRWRVKDRACQRKLLINQPEIAVGFLRNSHLLKIKSEDVHEATSIVFNETCDLGCGESVESRIIGDIKVADRGLVGHKAVFAAVLGLIGICR